MFRRWHEFFENCTACSCKFQSREGSCWGFLYATMTMLVGVLAIFMWFLRPKSLALGLPIIAVIALVLLLGSLPLRKGVALGIDVYFDPPEEKRPERGPEKRPDESETHSPVDASES